ncbi:hypothetical protein MMC07_004510, partial [Pseudocyphellaria aurata]|nr:hypothetical protein [Pseudocyphellaria aurata]
MVAQPSGLYLVIFISSFSIVCAIFRLIALITYAKSPSTDWGLPMIPFVSAMEAYVALMTSSIPAIYPLIVRPKSAIRSPNPQQQSQWRWDEEWQSKVMETLDSSQPITGASASSNCVSNGWTSAKALGHNMDVSRKTRNSIYEIPSSTVSSRNPSIISRP